jgi:hypothetical protein
MSKNAITIAQLEISCRHFQEMVAANVTENMAIRTLELFSDVYAKVQMGGSPIPHHVDKVELWSLEAKREKNENPNGKPKNHFRVEHGTPRRAFARKVFELYLEKKLNEQSMQSLVNKHWKLAVITLEEDNRLNKVARSKMFDTPEERWAAAEIKF